MLGIGRVGYSSHGVSDGRVAPMRVLWVEPGGGGAHAGEVGHGGFHSMTGLGERHTGWTEKPDRI